MRQLCATWGTMTIWRPEEDELLLREDKSSRILSLQDICAIWANKLYLFGSFEIEFPLGYSKAAGGEHAQVRYIYGPRGALMYIGN